MPGSVIASTARTPIGKLSGALAGFAAVDLGGMAITAALQRGGVDAEQVDYVVMGQVLQGGTGQITARQAAAKAGIAGSVVAAAASAVPPRRERRLSSVIAILPSAKQGAILGQPDDGVRTGPMALTGM